MFKKLKYLLPIIGSYLASLGGQGVKEWRRVVLPIILSIIGVISLQSWWGILLGTFGIWTAIGYGIPDYSFSTSTSKLPMIANINDAGSTLGRFWYKIFNYDHHLADIFTRGTIGFGMCLTGLIIPLLKLNWTMYAIGCLFIMIGQTVFSYRGWGEVKIGNKKLLVSDLINYALIFTSYLIMLI
jgi:hypothetical protein